MTITEADHALWFANFHSAPVTKKTKGLDQMVAYGKAVYDKQRGYVMTKSGELEFCARVTDELRGGTQQA